MLYQFLVLGPDRVIILERAPVDGSNEKLSAKLVARAESIPGGIELFAKLLGHSVEIEMDHKDAIDALSEITETCVTIPAIDVLTCE